MDTDYKKLYLVSSKWDKATELTTEIIRSNPAYHELLARLAGLMELAGFSPFVVASQAFLDLIVTIDLTRNSQAPALITGGTGTGKKLLAQAIYVLSPRKGQKFITFNCMGLSESDTGLDIEAQLFGYTKGSRINAAEDHKGVFEAAEGGTVLLDEIGELPLELQPKLLRFLQKGEITPVGATEPIKVDVRVIATTYCYLREQVRAGRFNANLYRYLKPYRLHIPPLRERREEIPYLVAHFLEMFQEEFHREGISLGEAAMEALCNYCWWENVLELRNEIHRLVASSCSDTVIGPERLSQKIRDYVPGDEVVRIIGDKIVVPCDIGYYEAEEQMSRVSITNALQETGSNLAQAAERLDVDRRWLKKKINELNRHAWNRDAWKKRIEFAGSESGK